MVYLLDEVAQHGFSDLEVGNYAVLHGPDGHDIARRSAQHSLCFLTDCQHVGGASLNGHDGGFSQYNAPISYVNEGIGSPEVYPNVVGKQAFDLREHELNLTRSSKERYQARVKRIPAWKGTDTGGNDLQLASASAGRRWHGPSALRGEC
jgi:hypothetical protein